MNKNKILGLIGIARRANKVTFGTQATTNMIEKRKVKLVILAQDSADRTKKNFIMICEKYNVKLRIFGTIQELSKSIGQNDKAIIGVLDENFSNEIIKIIDGGEIIG